MRSAYVLGAEVIVLLVAAQSSVAAKSSPIVGRWQTIRTCQGLVVALKSVRLGPLAPGAPDLKDVSL